MRYLVNRETKEHILDTGTAPMHGYWRRIEADSEGWIKHTGTVCPLPGNILCDVVFTDGSERTSAHAFAIGWNDANITHYKPILEQAEPVKDDQYRAATEDYDREKELAYAEMEAERKHMEIKEAELKRMMLLDRLKAAHEAAQQIPDLEAELRKVLWSMGYDLVSRSPFVDDSDHPPAQPQVPDGFVIVERSALSEVLRISDREHPAWESCRSAMLTASGKGE
jgi:hypothetical protein